MRKYISRTHAASNNLRTSVAGIFINIILSFFSRRIFVIVLGKEYVGLSSLIGNITVLLSLADFGAASAVIFHLYKALAKKDHTAVSQYLSCYHSFCRLSAFVTVVCGAALLPHLSSFVKDFDDVPALKCAFCIYICSCALGYFFSREQILLFADQKNYVVQLFSFVFGALSAAAECAVLIFTRNYIVYLCTHSLIIFSCDLALAVYVRKTYPEICFSSKLVCPYHQKKLLLREMMFLQPSNISGTLLRTVDNFLVVSLFGVAANGIYSNYNMLLGYAFMLSVTLISALSASVGNLSASESKEKSEKIFYLTSTASFFLINICTCLLFAMSQDIISLWLGNSLSLPHSVSAVLAANFFITALRRTPLIFRDSFGLYKYEKIKPFAELLASVILSVFFGKRMGMGGIYLGQAMSAFFVCLFYEPYILFCHGFEKSVFPYYARMIKYGFVSFLSCAMCYFACRYLPLFSLRFGVCLFIPCTMFFIFFFSSVETKRIMEMILKSPKSYRTKHE